jgi:hypothetical protein
MRKAGMLVGVALLALTNVARAQDNAGAAEPSASAAEPAAAPAGDRAASTAPEAVAGPKSRMHLGLAFLPMVLGKTGGGQEVLFPTRDAAVAFGIGVSLGYEVAPGLSVGIAPQALYNVKGKDNPDPSATEYDIMARLVYARAVVPKLAVYAEVLPGYSVISLPSWATNIEGAQVSNPKGFVLAFGAGAAMDIANRFFVNAGVGYQLGYQKGSAGSADFDYKTKFVRFALGGGVKI